MALPAPAIGLARHLQDPEVRFQLFQHLNYREAMSLILALRIVVPRKEFVHCILQCESGAPPNHDINIGPVPPTHNPVMMRRLPFCIWARQLHATVTNGPAQCGQRAQFFNAAVGRNEPSLCMEDHNQPVMGMHIGRIPVLVCQTCKGNRSVDFDWKLARLKFGVCQTCRTWALQNLQPREDRCTCAPAGAYNGGNRNNNERRRLHLCHRHFTHYWTQIQNAADREIQFRDPVRRTRHKKRGHGWTRKKKGAITVRTPQKRREATRTGPQIALGGLPYVPGNIHPPYCFCGNPLMARDHLWHGANMPPNADQIRNCVGCNGFVRQY